jgi:hypothetical protein
MMAVVMPVTYMLLTPLALFTLDTGSWETRGHSGQPLPEPAPAPVPQPVVSLQPMPAPLALASSNVFHLETARAARAQLSGELAPVPQEQHVSPYPRIAAAE